LGVSSQRAKKIGTLKKCVDISVPTVHQRASEMSQSRGNT
jgi:hypothetical protein